MRSIKYYDGGVQDPVKNKKPITVEALDEILYQRHGSAKDKWKFDEFRDLTKNVEAGFVDNPYTKIQDDAPNDPLKVGRGAYQFDYESAKTAYQRLYNIANPLGYSIPTLTDYDLKNVDKLEPEIQDMLFTAHLMNDKGSKITDILNDERTWAGNWADGHWKGDPENRPAKINMFNERYNELYNTGQ